MRPGHLGINNSYIGKSEKNAEMTAESVEEIHIFFRMWQKSSVVTPSETKVLKWTFIMLSQIGPSPFKK